MRLIRKLLDDCFQPISVITSQWELSRIYEGIFSRKVASGIRCPGS
jgi:hypothetical protein